MKNQLSLARFRGALLQTPGRHVIVLVSLAVLCVFLAYQSRLPMTIAIGGDSEKYATGFYFSQDDQEGHSYRWTRGNGVVIFSGVGKATPLTLSLVAYAWRDESQVYTATVTVNGFPVGTINKAGWRDWRFTISDPAILRTDELIVGVDSTPFIPSELSSDSQDDRTLGVAVDSVEIQSQWDNALSLERLTDWVTFPSTLQLLFVVAFVSLLYLCARYLGLSAKWSFYLGIAAVVLFGVGIAFFRLVASERVLILTLAVGALAVVGTLRGLNHLTLVIDRVAVRRIALFAIPTMIVVVAFLLRMHALARLPIEGDDGLYMNVAEDYAKAIEAADWGQVVAFDGVIEHPRLYVLCFAGGLVVRDWAHISLSNATTMRLVAAAFGALQTGLVALLNPLAGWFLAIQTTEVKFTSMAYLEALPALAIAFSILAFERFRRSSKDVWMYLSAIALGATGASKFIYLSAGFAILPFLLWEQRRQPRKIIAYGLLAALAFFVLDPYLWYDPLGRLQEMIFFHGSFSTRDYVQELARPWWYNLVWLASSAKIYSPSYLHPNIFLIEWDTVIYALGLMGLVSLARRSWLYFVWLVFGAIFLSLWQAKWEQYTLVIATPLCLSAGYCAVDAWEWLSRRWRPGTVLAQSEP